MLRDQLDQAHLANQQLTDNLRRATAELQQLREDYTQKTRDWKEEERVRLLENIENAFSLISLHLTFRSLINTTTKNIISCTNYGVMLLHSVNNSRN